MSQVINELDHELINAVKQYLETLEKGDEATISIWEDIAEEMKWTSIPSKSRWLDIQYNYIKIKSIIRNDWTLESILQVHPKTRMYLDGSLSFLDPYIKKIPDDRIPYFIHKRYQWVDQYTNVTEMNDDMKSSTLVTREMVQALLSERVDVGYFDGINMKYLMEVVENTTKQCIMKLKNNKEETRINKDVLKNGSTVMLDSNEEGDTNPVKLEIKDEDDIDSLEGDIIITTKKNVSILPHKTNETIRTQLDGVDFKQEVPDDTQSFNIATIKLEDDIVSTSEARDLKTFFNDLAESVSNKLTLEKQKELQKRVNLLVRELMEENK